jgi:hypothetical protein
VLRRGRPSLANPVGRAQALNSAIEGVSSAVIFQAPKQSSSPTLDVELKRLALAYASAPD